MVTSNHDQDNRLVNTCQAVAVTIDRVDARDRGSRFPDKLAQYVAAELDRRCWSNREAGRALKLSHVTIANLIYGETRYPDEATLAKLAGLRPGVTVDDLLRWHREPADPAQDPLPPIAGAPHAPAAHGATAQVDDEPPQWFREFVRRYVERAPPPPSATTPRSAHAGRPVGLPDQGDATDLARAVIEAEGYENIFSVRVRGDSLSDRTRPVLAGDTIWIDPTRPSAPGRAVAVVAGERLLLRTVGADEVTLHSADPRDPPLRLDEVDRVVGAMALVQITEP